MLRISKRLRWGIMKVVNTSDVEIQLHFSYQAPSDSRLGKHRNNTTSLPFTGLVIQE
jgi:hypothetical protein